MNENVFCLAEAQSIVQAALAHGRKLGLKPLTVAVLDRGGHLIAFAREDQSSNLRPQIAIGKAAGALSLGVSSRQIGEIPTAGGILLYRPGRVLVGAVGVTGDTSDNDELCALHGAAASGLSA